MSARRQGNGEYCGHFGRKRDDTWCLGQVAETDTQERAVKPFVMMFSVHVHGPI